MKNSIITLCFMLARQGRLLVKTANIADLALQLAEALDGLEHVRDRGREFNGNREVDSCCQAVAS